MKRNRSDTVSPKKQAGRGLKRIRSDTVSPNMKQAGSSLKRGRSDTVSPKRPVKVAVLASSVEKEKDRLGML